MTDSISSSLAVSPCSIWPVGMPVHASTTSAICSAPTSSPTSGSRSPRPSASAFSTSAICFSSAGIWPYWISRGAGEVALAQLLLGLDLQLVELATQLALALERGLLALPAGLEPAQLLLAVGEVLAQHVEPVDRRVVGLLGERELLHLQPVDLAAEHVDLLGRGLVLDPQARRRLVDQVDRLVGQLAAGDVAVGQRGGRDQRGVGDAHAVVGLVLLLDAAQDLDGVLDAGLADEDLLEAALQRGVLLDPLAVLVERGRADHVQLTARQHRLEHVAGVHRGVAAGARADDRVQLVDEGDDLPAGVLDLLEDGLEPLLELAAVLRARDHRGQVEAEHAPALERVGHVAGDDALGEALDDGGLADAGLADEDGVVLGAPAQDLDDAADLGVAADDRVEPAVLGRPGEVDGVLLERLVRRLGALAGHAAVAADRGDRLPQPGLGETGVGEHLLRGRLDGRRGDEEVLGGDVVVLHATRRGRAPAPAPASARRDAPGCWTVEPVARGSAAARPRPARAGRRRRRRPSDEVAGGAVLLLEQGDEQVDGLGVGVAAGGGGELGGLDDLAAAGGELLGTELAQLDLLRCRGGGPLWSLLCTTRQKLSRFPSTLESPAAGRHSNGLGSAPGSPASSRAPARRACSRRAPRTSSPPPA